MPCTHGFNVQSLKHLSRGSKKTFEHFTGFESDKFEDLLKFLVPDKDGKHIKYYDARSKTNKTDMSLLFDEDIESERQAARQATQKYKKTMPLLLKMNFFLVLMKLRLGHTN